MQKENLTHGCEFNFYKKVVNCRKIERMKTMTCKQLGGACDLAFDANTFDEIAELSKTHAMEMFQNGDEPHLKAMNEMGELMKRPNEMQAWFQNKRNEFDALPDND